MDQSLRMSAEAFKMLGAMLAHHYDRYCRDESSQEIVILILGAGASAPAQIPSWNLEFKREILARVRQYVDRREFINDAWDHLSPEIGPPGRIKRKSLQQELLIRATPEQICSVACRYPVLDVLIRELFVELATSKRKWSAPDGSGPPPLLAYELIAHLVKHRFVDHVVTLNFDELLDVALENELGSRGFRRIVSGYEPLDIHQKPLPTLIKLHGTVSSPETMRFTYLDVSVLTRMMRLHLETLFKISPRETDRRLRLVSLGYSWRDRSFAHWIQRHKGSLESLTVVRQTSRRTIDGRRQKITPGLLRPLSIIMPHRVRSISTMDLGKITIEDFTWALTEYTINRLQHVVPPQPVARHLLIGKLFDAKWLARQSGRRKSERFVLRKRAQVEVILHLAKSKGMVNTAGAPSAPRLRAYLERVQKARIVSAVDFLRELNLTGVMKRSPEPEAWDTYFSTARTIEEFKGDLSKALSAKAGPSRIRRPVFAPETGIRYAIQRNDDFILSEIGKIVDSSEVEVVNGVDQRDRLELYSSSAFRLFWQLWISVIRTAAQQVAVPVGY